MELELFREDLREDSKRIPTSQVRFEHLNDNAKRAILIAGSAVYYDYDRRNFNAVYPPAGELLDWYSKVKNANR